ncbi:MAG: MFS transporter [Chloroflexi bacterium]|nr:MFS transporter [Chloroflexota bacterium]
MLINRLAHQQWQRNNLAAFLAVFILTAGYSFTGPFLPLYLQEIAPLTDERAAFWAGIAHGLGGFGAFVTGPIWGVLGDRYGRKAMLVRSAFGGAATTLLFAFAGEVWQIVLIRFSVGVMAGAPVAAMALIAAYTPKEKQTQAFGSLQAATMLGLALGPALGGVLVEVLGFERAFISASAVMFVGALVTLVIIKEDVSALRVAQAGKRGFGFDSLSAVLRSPGALLAFFVILMLGLNRPMMQPVLPSFVKSLMVSGGPVTLVVAGLFFGTALLAALSALLAGHMTARMGIRRLLIFSYVIGGLLMVSMAAVQNVPQLATLALLQALSLGGLQTSSVALLSHAVSPAMASAAFGLFQSMQAVTSGVGPMAGGGLAVLLGFRGVFLVAGGMFLFAALAVHMAMRRPAATAVPAALSGAVASPPPEAKPTSGSQGRRDA